MRDDIEIIGSDQPVAWQAALQEARPHDFYHRHDYHRLAEDKGEGEATLFVYRLGRASIALPLMLRRVAEVAGLEKAGEGLRDATSVYGYPGPLSSRRSLSPEMVSGFQEALKGALDALGIVSLFSRLHPLIRTEAAIEGLGRLVEQGETVSIDLTLPEEAQLARYRSGHRYDLKKLGKMNFAVAFETGDAAIEEFVSIYHANMQRVNASAHYLFDFAYFHRLMSFGCFQMIGCRVDGALVAGALFSNVDEIAQYHLSATATDWLRMAPMKLVLDEARRWARSAGCTVLHLGGGVGAQEDALFRFKSGFSPDRHAFRTWRWEVDPAACARLSSVRAATGQPPPPSFFPAYRG